MEKFALGDYKEVEATSIPRKTLKLVAVVEVVLVLRCHGQKYMNVANLFLYQHPLFTVMLLFIIGLALGMSVTFLSLEVFYSVCMCCESEL